MLFKTVREAFDWLQDSRDGKNDRNCWHAVLAYEQARKGADLEGQAGYSAAHAALLLVGMKDTPNDAIFLFTDGDGNKLLDVVNAFVSHIIATGHMVPTTVEP